MDKELKELMDQLISSQGNGNEANVQDVANAINTYIKPFEEKLSSPLSSIESENATKCDANNVEIVASDY